MSLAKNLALVCLSSSALLSLSLGITQLPPAYAADATAALTSFGPNGVADIAQAAAPAVVNIDVNETPAAGGSSVNGLPEGFQFFFNGQPANPKNFHMPERKDTGSGFIIRPDGYILTNSHVVKNADKIKVTLNDKREFDGKVVGIDYFSDLAVIKINANNLATLKMGTSTNLRPGEFAIAIGSPLGYDHTVTFGIISAVGRSVVDINGNVQFIQTDAAINPGNSGGPLLNLAGEVIGVNTAIANPLHGQNIGFSIPIDIAKTTAESLIANGKVLRPWLGIKMHELDNDVAKEMGLAFTGTPPKGVVIVDFVDGSPAKASGLEQGDIIQKIDGKDMPMPKDIKEYVQSKKVTDILHFDVLRKNNPQTIAVNVGNYSDMMDKHR